MRDLPEGVPTPDPLPGASARTSFGSFRQLDSASPGFWGLEYRLTENTTYTAVCFWLLPGAGDELPLEIGGFRDTCSNCSTLGEQGVQRLPPQSSTPPTAVTLTLGAATVNEDASSDSTATEGVDYTKPAEVRVAEGQTSGSATIAIAHDAVDEDDETVIVAVFPAAHTIDPSTWDRPVTFAVNGLSDDDTNDERVGISHRATSVDGKYNNLPVSTVSTVAVAVTDSAQDQGQQQAKDHSALIARVREWRNEPAWVDNKTHTDRWDRVLLALGESVADTSLTPMTAAEAQELADRGWQRWVEVAEALWEIEAAVSLSRRLNHSPNRNRNQSQRRNRIRCLSRTVNPHAGLIAEVRAWRNDFQWVSHKSHTDRWDRVLLALGETAEDSTLTPMTAAEAQELADSGWQRWVEVAQALVELEGR